MEAFLGLVIFFYLGTIFESQELLNQQNDFIEDHKYPKLESIPHESKTCLSLNPIASNVIGSAFRMAAIVEDTTMDVVQRLLMFGDECILVDEEELGHILYKATSHGKWGEYELDYLVRELALHPNPEEVASVKYLSKE